MSKQLRIYEDMQLVQFPRFNEKITPMLCFDDCISTFGTYINAVYEKAYINALEIDFDWCEQAGIGKSYHYGTRLEENVKKYCGIDIKSIKCDKMDAVAQIMGHIDENTLVCAEVLGLNCPWDWRYQIEEQGAHYFFITGYDEDERCFNCVDPFYQIMNENLSFDNLQNGIQSYDIFQVCKMGEKNKDIDELLNSINTLFNGGYLNAYYIFADKFRSFDIAKEVEDYSAESEFMVENIENNIPLNYVFKDIIHNRLRFSVYLRRIAERNKQFSNELTEFSDKYITLSQKWESARLMLIKFLIVNRIDKITGNLADKLELILHEEEETLQSLLSMVNGQYKVSNISESTDLHKDVDSITLDISAYFNNEGIAVGKENTTADFNDKGEFILYEYFPKDQIMRCGNFSFLIQEKRNGEKDNIQCNSETISVDADYYSGLEIMGCSEWGDYTEELTVVFEDGSFEKISFTLYDWIPNYLHDGDMNVLIETKKSIRDDVTTEEDCNVYGVICTIKEKKKITHIRLPECTSMHIFALTLLKSRNSKKDLC